MRRFLTTMVLSLLLTGCVGYSIATQAEPKHLDEKTIYNWKSKFASEEFRKSSYKYQLKKLDDGKSIYSNTNWSWCGFTLFAIVPIPFLLPVCENGIEYHVQNDVVIDIVNVRTRGNYGTCGLLLQSHLGRWCAFGSY